MLAVAHVLGVMMAFFGVTYLLPMICTLITGDGMLPEFLAAATINVVVGLLVALATRSRRRELKPRDGFLLVTLSWVLMSGSAALPFLIALPNLSFTDAYFEAMSGLTTTGATVLTGLDALPPSINLWRHSLHWFGGHYQGDVDEHRPLFALPDAELRSRARGPEFVDAGGSI